MWAQTPDLVLHNANVITLGASFPRVNWVAVSGEAITVVGVGRLPSDLLGGQWRVIDCQGGTLVPGFNDAHCHVLATASSLMAVDCSPSAVSSIDELADLLRRRAADTPAGAWIRATGYNEFYFREKRHPTRRDLDAAVPERPVRLTHRSGHAVVLNSRALALAGITSDTPDPTYGVIDRDPDSGEPTGLLLEMDEYLDGVVPPPSREDIYEGVRRFNRQCLALGLTSLQDATPGNSPERWRLFKELKEQGILTPDLTLMAGASHLESFLEEGFAFGHRGKGMRLGAAKIMLTMTTGSLSPSPEELQSIVGYAHRNGFQVAIHAVEMEAVETAIEAIRLQAGDLTARRHRIEHCSECPPRLVESLARCGITVVTQPGFIYHSGERYLSEVEEERRAWLYPIGSLKAAGVPVAAGSDAPVAPIDPITGVYAAVTRRAASGDPVLPNESVSADDALRMHTLGSAYASFQEHERGSVEVGKRADLVLLDRDPTAIDPEEIRNTRVQMTIAGGEVVWEGP